MTSTTIYLTWFYEDRAPQLLMPTTKDNFMLEGSLSTNTEKGTRFFTGIVVKFDSERKILFGNYRNRKISIFFPEEQMNFAVKEKNKVSNYLVLRIECNTSEIKFLLREEKGADFQTLMISKLEEKVLYIGFFSNKHDRFSHEAYITNINYEVY